LSAAAVSINSLKDLSLLAAPQPSGIDRASFPKASAKIGAFLFLAKYSGGFFLLKNIFFHHIADFQEEKFSSNKQKTRVNKQKRRVNLPLLL
jgi:hypothetical protein